MPKHSYSVVLCASNDCKLYITVEEAILTSLMLFSAMLLEQYPWLLLHRHSLRLRACLLPSEVISVSDAFRRLCPADFQLIVLLFDTGGTAVTKGCQNSTVLVVVMHFQVGHFY